MLFGYHRKLVVSLLNQKYDTQHNSSFYVECHILALYAECYYAECRSVEYRGAS